MIKCEATGRAAIVDPGGDVERILEAVAKMDATVEKIILTHAHMDHCAASDVLRQQLQMPIEGPHKDDDFWLEKLPEWCQMSGFPTPMPFCPTAGWSRAIRSPWASSDFAGDALPGSYPGHVVFLYQPQKVAWVGDVLFQGSIGRTDFPKGNHDDLISSIRDKLFPLGDDITFIPGHGPTSTFGQERQTNPFVADTAMAECRQ